MPNSKKKPLCKEGKREHSYRLVSEINLKWFKDILLAYECSVCKKKDVKFLPKHKWD